MHRLAVNLSFTYIPARLAYYWSGQFGSRRENASKLKTRLTKMAKSKDSMSSKKNLAIVKTGPVENSKTKSSRAHAAKTQPPSFAFSNFIRQWRVHRGMTQEQLAREADYTGSAISQLENGQSKYTQTFLEAIAKALDCHPADLLMVNPEPESVEQQIERLCKLVPGQRRKLLLSVLRSFVEADD